MDGNTAIIIGEDDDDSNVSDDESADGVASVMSMDEHSRDTGSTSKGTGGISRYAYDISPITPEEAANNVEFLNTQAKSWLAVLFNVFTSVEKEGRQMVGDVISAWASIAKEPVS